MDDAQLADACNQRIVYRLIHNGNGLIQRHTAHINLLLGAARFRNKHLMCVIAGGVLTKALAFFRLVIRMRRLRLRQQAFLGRHGHLQNTHLHRYIIAVNIGNHAVFTQGYNKNIQSLLRRFSRKRRSLRQRCLLAQRFVELFAGLLGCLLQALGVKIGLHRAQLLEHCLALTAAAAVNIIRLLARLAQHLVFAAFKLALGIGQRVAQLLTFAAQILNLPAAAFVAAAFAVQLLQHAFHMHMFLVQKLACVLNNILRKAQTAADVEGITAAGHAHQQAVRRPQRYRVKLHAGVFHTLVTISKGFQLAVVRRHHRQHTLLMQMLQHRHRQCGTLIRVSTCTNFVNKHQISCFYLTQNAD